jgi:threonine dehydrogenase-like Zn-dependent dehydrogenase
MQSDMQSDMRESLHTLTTFYFDDRSGRFLQKTTQRHLGVNEVLLKTTHASLCYTDVHAKSKGCGLGHEGVGLVQEVGMAVSHMKAGDRVGWGWLHSVLMSRYYSANVEALIRTSLAGIVRHAYRAIDNIAPKLVDSPFRIWIKVLSATFES